MNIILDNRSREYILKNGGSAAIIMGKQGCS